MNKKSIIVKKIRNATKSEIAYLIMKMRSEKLLNTLSHDIVLIDANSNTTTNNNTFVEVAAAASTLL